MYKIYKRTQVSPSLNLKKWLLCFPSFCLGKEILSSSSILTTLPTAERRIRTPPSTLPGDALRTGPSSVTSWSILIPTTLSARVLNHITMPPDNLIEEKSTFFSSLKRKAADQRITATQNIVSEVLEGASKDLYMHRGADMTYVGMHTNIADSCAPGPDNCAPGPDSCAPDPDNCAPVYMMT